MSQSPIAHLENDDEDFLIVPEDSSPVSQRKLKRLKRVALQSPQEQNLVSERNGEKQTVFESELTKLGPGLEDMSANELNNNDLEFNAASQGLNKREREDVRKQNITHENSYNPLDEVQKASHDKKDNAVEDEVAKNHERGESSKGKKNSRETSTPEEIKGKKKSRKDSATTEERESSKGMKNLRKTSTTEEVKGKERSKKDFDTTDVRELGKCKKDSMEFSITEEIKGKKKSRKIAVTTKEYAADATNELHAREGKAVSSLLEKKKKKKKLESSSTPLDKEMEDAGSAPGKRGQKKKNKDELEEIHAESQRLLRETRDASFKPQPVVGKSISSVLEKIRFRKIQLEQKAGKGLDGMQKNSSGSEGHSEGLSDESDNMEFENDDEDKDGAMQEDHHMENEGYNSEEVNCSIPPVNDSGIPRTPENYTETSLSEKGPKQGVPKINDGFRAPVEDTQDLFCNSQLSYGEDEVENPLDSTQEEEILAPALLSMNLKLDSHPQEDDLSDEDDNKENVDPSPSKPVEAPVYSKAAPVKAFVDDEAEDEDEDILVGQDEEDASDADENEDLQDIMATAEEEHPIDHERREELHRKWLEQQDAAATGDILLRLRSGWKQRDPRGWKTSVLDEDDADFVSQEDDIMECDDEPVHYRPVPEPAKHANDSSNLEKLSWETTIDKDDGLESSDDEELEQRLLRQRILKESEEQEVFMGPAEDESSREVFGLIKKVNVASISKKKTKPASTFLETLYSGGNSNSSLKSSFLGRPTSSSLQSSHKQGLCGSKSYIFGRDDSNSRHGTSKTGSQGDSVFELQDQKENEHSTDARKKGISTEGKAKNSESANKKANNTNDSSAGPSLFEILKRQTSEMDRTLQSRNTNTIQEYRQAHTISHFAAFKSSISAKIVKKAG